MSDPNFEAEVARAAGGDALPVLQCALERCRLGRYKMRSRSEQLLGDLVETWEDLQSTLDGVNEAFRGTQYSTSRHRLNREIDGATSLSLAVIDSIANCIPANTQARTNARAEQFLRNVSRSTEVEYFTENAAVTVERLKAKVHSSIRDDQARSSQPTYARRLERANESYIPPSLKPAAAFHTPPTLRFNDQYESQDYNPKSILGTIQRTVQESPFSQRAAFAPNTQVIRIQPRQVQEPYISYEYISPKPFGYHGSSQRTVGYKYTDYMTGIWGSHS
ncbi:MAG: hypothetical protein M1827_001745 [Pycnora praestabilis]|nr:MAG: hypothetical protein M1827_001745 [Pycnora praestabilis]